MRRALLTGCFPIAEIERTIKKVNEGVDNFETTFEKISQTTNQAQKDKLELDLKKEIKKLQRFRDQIKNWLSSSDVKDKKQLLDNRKIIESVNNTPPSIALKN